MRRLVILALLAVMARDAAAQPAEAIGHPLPSQKVPVGTLTVRVIAGEMSAPVTEHDVRLTVDGEVRIARTDASGRASFPGLKPGATVKAATDGDAGEVLSDEFPIPGDSGVAVMLTTKPMKADAMGGGPGGRPAPRMMAGQPRPEQADPAGDVTVRVTYNDLDSMEGVADRPVVMVKYGADGKVASKVIHTDAAGRAAFEGLDTSGDSAYYAMTMLPRDGHTDRTMSMPIVPTAEVGIRVMLSGEKMKSGEPMVDDLSKFSREPELPPGQLMVIFGGDTPDKGTVELHDCADGKLIASAPVQQGRPIPSTVTATVGDAVIGDALAAGTISLTVMVAASGQELPLPRTPIRLLTPAGGPTELTGETDDDGKLVITGAPIGVPLTAVVDIQGKTFTGNPFTLAADHGDTIAITTSFELLSLGQASFAGIAATPEGAYYTDIQIKGERFRSPPFQMAPERGVVVPIFLFTPRLQFAFSLDAFVDDDYLAVRGQFVLQNASFSPYAGPSEGLRIPAPAGATGLVLADESKPFAAVDGGAFRLLRAVPPMGGEFRAGFSLPMEHGKVHWDLPLPLGSSQSSLAIRMTPGMKVNAPKKSQGKQVKDPQSGFTWYAIQDISIAADQRMVFDVEGLPERPEWQHWARLFTGLAVLLLLTIGVAFAATASARATSVVSPTAKKERRRRIEDSLDQVAEMDRAGTGAELQRENLVVQLEQLYAEEGERG